jgi:hypothetical protein
MKIYSYSQVKTLIEKYENLEGFELRTISEGVLGYGQIVLEATGKKTALVTEVALNEWSHGYKVRMYNQCPKKYQ